MIDLALDPLTRDLVVRQGNPVPLDGAARVTQAVSIRLRTWLGEWFLDTEHGVPYVQQVLGKQRPEMVEAVLRAQILSVAGVQRILAFSLDVNAGTRVATVQFTAESAEGLVSGTATLGGIR